MPAYVVYLDEVILGNLVMNYAILWSAAQIGQINTGKRKLAAGAALGSIYSLALFIPQLNSLLAVSCKLLMSLLIVFTAYGPLPCKRFFKALGCFYLCSFILGGVVFGCIYFLRTETGLAFTNPGSSGQNHFWYGIALALGVAWVMGKGTELARRRAFQESYKIPLSVTLWGSTVEVEALLDTGNGLVDPLTRHPVVIVEYAVLKLILPPPIQNLCAKENISDLNLLQNTLSGSKWADRFRLIPFQSLGRSDGLLLGFRPDEIIAGPVGQKKRIRQVVVGIYLGQLDAHAYYRALLHPMVLGECAA